MKKVTTSQRLKEIMNERKLKQVDILELAQPYCKKFGVKLNKNDLSQYVSGKVEPGQYKLTILGYALNVSEAWLMGYDVPKYPSINFDDRIDEKQQITNEALCKALETIKAQFAQLGDSIFESYCENEECILALYHSLNYAGKKEALKRILELTELARYTEQNQSNISVDTTNKTYTARVAAFGGNNKVYQLSEEQISRAMDILREDEEDEE